MADYFVGHPVDTGNAMIVLRLFALGLACGALVWLAPRARWLWRYLFADL